MKNKCCIFLFVLILSITTVCTAAEYENEIQFRNTPWGISYTEAKELFPEYGLWPITGEHMKFYPITELYSDQYDFSNTPTYHDINIIGETTSNKIDVAGYKTTNIELFFAYTVIDGVITHEEADSRLYGAKYTFEPADALAMIDDLKGKLSSLYGDIDEEGSDTGIVWDHKWWIWRGANQTAVSLTFQDEKDSERDKVWISYFTYEGDKWLYEASDGEKERLLRLEREGAANGGTDGL